MLHPEGWSPADVLEVLADADVSRKAAKAWVLPGYARQMRQLVDMLRAAPAEAATLAGDARLPPCPLKKQAVKHSEVDCCASCRKPSLQLSKCSACKQVGTCTIFVHGWGGHFSCCWAADWCGHCSAGMMITGDATLPVVLCKV